MTFKVTSVASLRSVARIVAPFAFYLVVVTLGILSMGFQLLGSRLLGPHFGSGIDVWAWLISTFLAAFSAGSMSGGWISHLPDERRGRVLWTVAGIAVATLAFTATLGLVTLDRLETARAGLFLSCLTLFFVPVTALSCFGPQYVHFLAARGMPPGKASGVAYGVSTLGNIGGVMLTAFVLLPNFRVSTLLYVWLVVASVGLTLLLKMIRAPSAP